MILSFITVSVGYVFALPQYDSKLKPPDVSIDTPDPYTMNITAPDKSILAFSSFNIAQNETVHIIQLENNSTCLARVTGKDPSDIIGTFKIDQNFILINPNGINIAPTANIQANNLILSTLNISDSNFISGNYEFARDENSRYSSVVNEGAITGTNIALIGSAVSNGKTGIITATAGTVHLVSGDKAVVTFDRLGLISVEVTEATSGKVIDKDGNTIIKDAVANSGTIEAHRVYMTAKTAKDIFENAVNNTGIVRATDLVNENGVIKITANGNVKLQGSEIPGIVVDAPDLSIYKTTPNIYIEKVTTIGDYINIEGDGINVTYLKTANVTLQANGLIDTSPTAILAAKTLTLIADRFGSNASALNINTENLTLKKLTGSIDIVDSIGIGDSIFMTGPPDEDNLNIAYNKGCNLTLDANKISVVGSDPTHFLGEITFSNLSCIIPGKIIIFESGHLYTILGTLTIQGAENNNITLQSSIPGKGNEFTIYINTVSDAKGDPKVKYVTVKDSVALGPIVPIPADSIFKTNADGWDAAYFWVGGTGNWSDAAHWSAISGGGGGAGVPAGGDLATFDGGSGGGICTVDAVVGIQGLSMNAGNTTNIILGANLTAGLGITVTAGTFDSVSFKATTFLAPLTVSSTIKVGGATFADSFATIGGAVTLNAGSTVEYSRSGDQTINNTLNYANLATSGSGTKTLGGNTTITENLVVGAGTTVDPVTFKITATGVASNLNLSGTIKADSAAFTDNYSGFVTYTINAGSTVNYTRNGAQAITNAFNYSDLTVSGTGTKTFAGNATATGTFTDTVNNSILTFNAGSTYAFTNIAINGTAGNNVTMQSSAAGNAWLFNVTQASPTVSFVTVRDSNASGGSQITATNNVTNSGGNTNWNFGGSSPTPPTPPTDPINNNPIYNFPPPNNNPPPEPPPAGGSSSSSNAAANIPNVGEQRFRRDYEPGDYRTIVVVEEGQVVVIPYTEEGMQYSGSITLLPGQKTTQSAKIGYFDRVSSVVIMPTETQAEDKLFSGVSSQAIFKRGSRWLANELITRS